MHLEWLDILTKTRQYEKTDNYNNATADACYRSNKFEQ